MAFGKTTKDLDTTLPIIDQAASVIAKGITAASRAGEVGQAIGSFTSQTTILSRIFIEEALLQEPIISGLQRDFHSWYAAQIISALNLSQMVNNMQSVQDVMSIVQTGHNRNQSDPLKNLFSRGAGLASFMENYTGEATEAQHFEDQDPFLLVTKDQLNNNERQRDEALAKAKKLQEELSKRESTVSVKSVNVSEHKLGPMGELYEVKLSNPNGGAAPISVPVFIQMQPSIVPTEIAPRFIDMNVSPTLWQRWTMMTAGELTFWKDFILHRDMNQRFKAIIKDPKKASLFNDFLKTVHRKDKYALSDLHDKSSGHISKNLANSVVVFSEDTVMRAKVDSGIDLHNPVDRTRYFRDTYTMIIAVVDPMYQRVTIYFNGLDGEIDASYNDFKGKDAKTDPKDFMAALTAFSTNSIGRMR